MALPQQINVGTQAGPIVSPDQQRQMIGGIHQFGQQLAQHPMFKQGYGNPAAGQAANAQFGGNLNNNNNRYATTFDRQMSSANADELLRSQTARAGMGNQFMQQGAQAWNQDLANQFGHNSMLLNLLNPLLAQQRTA